MSETPSPAPAGYTPVHHFILTEKRTLLWMNIIGSLLFILALAVVFTALLAYDAVGAPLVIATLPEELPVWLYFLLLVGTLILHEALHGLAMIAYGIRPHFGVKWQKLVLFTTSDACFSRTRYLVVTLAPLVGITLLGLAGMLILPRGVAIWVGIMVAMNAASSIGDGWMAAVIASFASTALFRDEADGMSVFMPQEPGS